MKKLFGIFTLVILMTLVAVPVQAESPIEPEPKAAANTGTIVHLPLIKDESIRSWFRPEELNTAMTDLGYGDDVWDMLTGCTLDDSARPEVGLIRYSGCTLYLTQVGGKYDILFYYSNQVQRVIWWYLEG